MRVTPAWRFSLCIRTVYGPCLTLDVCVEEADVPRDPVLWRGEEGEDGSVPDREAVLRREGPTARELAEAAYEPLKAIPALHTCIQFRVLIYGPLQALTPRASRERELALWEKATTLIWTIYGSVSTALVFTEVKCLS